MLSLAVLLYVHAVQGSFAVGGAVSAGVLAGTALVATAPWPGTALVVAVGAMVSGTAAFALSPRVRGDSAAPRPGRRIGVSAGQSLAGLAVDTAGPAGFGVGPVLGLVVAVVLWLRRRTVVADPAPAGGVQARR